ncbi:cupin domain-containing protein [Mesorhizobium sp. B2-4-9]|uniref:cupin domain-containing protein n=1 Tax=Mesorhizobium sp. B2-4-9 TaxID=2589940 RepID=UPI0015E2E61E|nr:cupin domain-containing protein [Mesorhizobium sp. B2-4-9]
MNRHTLRSEQTAPAGTGSEAAGFYIGEVADMLGVSASKVRQWDKHGLIAPLRTKSGYRIYPVEQFQRMRRIRDLSNAGVNLAGIKHALAESASSQGNTVATPPALLGFKLQNLRKKKKVSLRQLGTTTGLSPSYISAVERSVANPSFAALLKLANALDTNTVALLGGAFVPNKLIVKENERRPLDINLEGIEIQQLFRAESSLESLLFVLEPGSHSGESYKHPGEEFLFVLEGRLDLTLDETEDYVLDTGDAMTFASHRPHKYGNSTNQITKVLWVNTPPTY